MNVTAPPAPALAPAVFAAAPLDALFRRNAAAHPTAIALVDPPDRANFTDGNPRQFTYAEAELAVRKLARRLRSFGLPRDSVVAMALPNTVEATLSLLAILRAGYVAAPVPVLWGRADFVRALDPINAKALITIARLGDDRPAEVACAAAAELFSLSFPCAFGRQVPDGAVPLDLDQLGSEAGLEAEEAPASDPDDIAIVTFDAAGRGPFAVARDHREWTAAGFATLVAAAIEPGDTIVTSLPPTTLAGIGGAFVPWLLSGGTLQLLAGPASDVFASVENKTHLLAPAAALVGSEVTVLGSCIAVHRAPRTLTLDFSTLAAQGVVDLTVFGEIGALAVRRTTPDRASPLPLGAVAAPHAREGAPAVIETRVADGVLHLGGAMVPKRLYPAVMLNARLNAPRLEPDEEGFVRTGFRARAEGEALVVDGAPRDVAAIGALRFGLDDVAARVAAAAGDAAVYVVEDALLGNRILVEADDLATTASALEQAGCARLLVEAVTQRAQRRAAG